MAIRNDPSDTEHYYSGASWHVTDDNSTNTEPQQKNGVFPLLRSLNGITGVIYP